MAGPEEVDAAGPEDRRQVDAHMSLVLIARYRVLTKSRAAQSVHQHICIRRAREGGDSTIDGYIGVAAIGSGGLVPSEKIDGVIDRAVEVWVRLEIKPRVGVGRQ